MDIILINTIGAFFWIGLLGLLIVVMGYKLYRGRKVKKFNLLRMKQYGGIRMTESEQKFINKNSQLGNGRISLGIFRIQQRWRGKKIKKAISRFFSSLSPFYKYKVKISEIEKDLDSSHRDASYYKDQYSILRQEIKELTTELKELRTPVKKPTVAEFIKKEQAFQKSSLPSDFTVGAGNQFV